MNSGSQSLAAVLLEKKAGIVSKWLERTFQSYPESSANFLMRQEDPFRNPVGYRIKEGLSVLFDRLVLAGDAGAGNEEIENIVRIHATQDVSAGRAVAFVFTLKQILRTEFAAEIAGFPDESAALDLRIDEMALLAFDLYMKCRERIYEIKANESRRMTFFLERMNRKESAGSVE